MWRAAGSKTSPSTSRPSGWCRRSGPRRRWCSNAGASLAEPRSRNSGRPTPTAGWNGRRRRSSRATTRLAEHWAHGLDITEPLEIPFPDTDRLRHVAWLGHATLPYAFALAGDEPHDVFCELVAPDGSSWRYGPEDADSTISGSAGAFCRVGARRLAPDESGLVTTGPHGRAALEVLRNYAG